MKRIMVLTGIAFCLMALGAPVRGATWIVKPDGTGDFPTIQAAIDAAAAGDVIALAAGVFKGAGNRDVDFRGKAVTVRSQNGNPRTCVIDVEGVYPLTPYRAFIFQMTEGPDSVLRDLTIIHGATGDG